MFLRVPCTAEQSLSPPWAAVGALLHKSWVQIVSRKSSSGGRVLWRRRFPGAGVVPPQPDCCDVCVCGLEVRLSSLPSCGLPTCPQHQGGVDSGPSGYRQEGLSLGCPRQVPASACTWHRGSTYLSGRGSFAPEAPAPSLP